LHTHFQFWRGGTRPYHEETMLAGLVFSDDSDVDDALSSPSPTAQHHGTKRTLAPSGSRAGGSGAKTAAAAPAVKKRRPTVTPAPSQEEQRRDENDEYDEEYVSQSQTDLDVAATVALIIQQQKSRAAKKGAQEKKKLLAEFKASVVSIEEEYAANLAQQGGELLREVQRVTKALAAENEKQDKEDAAFAKDVAAFERDTSAFEKRVKGEMKKVREAQGAAEGACDKLADGLASFARNLVEKTTVDARKIRAKRLSLAPVVKSLTAAVLEVESSATE